jgi:two-component system response regulator YesN
LKVLIVDDEEHVREGIELAIDWEKFGVTERLMAENGEQAIEIIRRDKPAVLFCDMSMPGMNGLELLNLIRNEGWEVQIIVVSGYDDFVYTKAAIRANGVDYILKPFRKKDLEQAFERATTAWQHTEISLRDKRETVHRLRQADAILDEQKLGLYFKGEAAFHEGIRKLIHKVGLPILYIRAAIILPRNRLNLVNQRFQGDDELFLFAVNNIAHETLRTYGSHYICRLDEYQWLLITGTDGKGRTAAEHKEYLNRVTDRWKSTLGLQVLVGFCETEAGVESLPNAIKEAKAALLQCDLLQSTSQKNQVKENVPRFMDQQILLTALKNKNKAHAEEIIHSFTVKLKEGGSLSLKDLQIYTIELNLLLEQASLNNSTGKETTELIPLWISDLDEWEKVQIKQWWARIDQEGTGGISTRNVQTIHEYICRHFQEDISLSTLSEQFHFSPQYIAKKFKELYNTTVMTFLIDLRMEKATSFLIHTDMSVSQVANAVGYSDENYFGKVFRKQNGLSPLQFRKQQKDS